MSDHPPGSYLVDDEGNHTPNLNDEAMAERHAAATADEKPATKKEKANATSAN